MGVKTKFSAQVTGAIKAELARRDIDGVALVDVLELSRNSVYARLRGERPFDTDEIAAASEFLGMSILDLLASASIDAESTKAVA
ncbi:hypothetical protein [Microbacterium allomyrinae]|uniref:Uncharacterized protein n=1 Tax=Microbacterium allomyrinae TaxID=2830666 RepID=A0A9X1S2A1_9MICO|nr:hypothetical protein [Microbacterium allomyrinae]MCC2031799.1 hypothetical protein [Microbacterium allomyrinae]